MKAFALNALDQSLQRGATYADVRVVDRQTEELAVKNESIDQLKTVHDAGFGIRVLADGAWGFAADSSFTNDSMVFTVQRAIDIARASAQVRAEPLLLPQRPGEEGSYATPLDQDPFDVPMEACLALLVACSEAMKRHPSVRVAEAKMSFFREKKWFVCSEGSSQEQTVIHSGGGVATTAVGEAGVFQRRSFENHAQAGYEFITDLDLLSHAERCAEEAEALTVAPVCPSGPKTVILGSAMLALQIHESCGHPIELDRVLGTEASFAGTSFVTVDNLGLLQYGAPAVNITADATLPRGLGTYGWDDEGCPAERFPIVQEGRFVNYLTSRETAWWLAHHYSHLTPRPPLPFSNATMRADGWGRLPLIRMTNISLEPGDWTLEDLISSTEDGLYLDTPKSWSLDDKRLNFHFGTEVAYEVKNGKLGRLLRDASYTDRTPRFWNSCEAICQADHWQLWGIPSCAKGEPVQVARVAHGAAPARFRGVQVRGGR
jgi:TldD protein